MFDILTLKKEDEGKHLFRLVDKGLIDEWIVDREPSLNTVTLEGIIKLRSVEGFNNCGIFNNKFNRDLAGFRPELIFTTKKEVEEQIEKNKNELRNKLKNGEDTLNYLFYKGITQIKELSPYDEIQSIDLTPIDIIVIKEKIKEYFGIDIKENYNE